MTIQVADADAGRQLRCPRLECGAVFTASPRPSGIQSEPATQVPFATQNLSYPPAVPIQEPAQVLPSVLPARRARPVPPRGHRRAPPPEPDDPTNNTSLQHGLGIAALTVGTLGLIFGAVPCFAYFGVVAGVVGVILGVIGVMVALGHQRKGMGLPLAGAGLSVVPIVVGVIWISLGLITARSWVDGWFGNLDKSFGKIKSEFKQIEENSKKQQMLMQKGHDQIHKDLLQIGQAILSYESATGHLPASGGANGNLSWRVHILPYLGEDALHKQFKLDESWDSPNNKSLLSKMPKVFAPVKLDAATPNDWTYYQVFTQPDGPFPLKGKGLTLKDISAKDGTAQTFLVVESGDAVPWTKPADMPYKASAGLPRLGKAVPSGFHAVMFDGKACFIHYTTPENTKRLWIMHNDERPVNPPGG